MEKATSNILEECSKLFLHQGVKSVSVEEISRAANTSKKELYSLFENKEGIIKAWIRYDLLLIDEKNNYYRENEQNAVAEILAATQYTSDRFRNISPVLFFDLQKYYKSIYEYMVQIQQEICFQCILQNLERGIDEGLYRTEIDQNVVSRLWFSKILLVQDSTLFPLAEYSLQTLLYQFMELHVRSIATPKGIELFNSITNQSQKR